MDREIKERIAAINSGVIPEGYKKTKVGIVPVEWETVRLKTISKHSTEKNKDLKYRETYTNSATQGIIKQTDYFDKQISNNENIDGYYVVRQNDYVYNPRISVSAPCGPISKSHFSETGVMSPLYTVFRLNDEYEDNGYIEHYFKSSFWYRYMSSVANYGARHNRMNITNEDLFNMPIPFPPLPEQQKIAEILSTQDKLIELQEKKIEQLKELKKAYLQKMFPKKGSKYPELRFKGFSDPWEQRKLSELLTPSDERNSDGKYTQDDVLAASLGTELVKKHIFFGLRSTEESVKNYRVVKSGDIIYTKSPIKGFPNGIVRTSKGAEGIVPSLYCVYKCTSSINPCIIQSYLEDKTRLDAYLMPLVNIGARNNVNITDLGFLEGTVMIPQDIEEQTKIVNLLDTLTELITLHQRKSEQEKQKKKALMQLLLTGIVRTK